MGARVARVIITQLERRGDGISDQIRVITQFWTLDGRLLCECDPVTDKNYSQVLSSIWLGDEK